MKSIQKGSHSVKKQDAEELIRGGGEQVDLSQEERPELGQVCSQAPEGREGLVVRTGLESPDLRPLPPNHSPHSSSGPAH